MAWFRVDDSFHTSKSVMRIPRRYRAAAIGFWTLAGAWSSQEELDGFIPEYAIDELCGTTALANHLVKAGLWEVTEESQEGSAICDRGSPICGEPGWRFRNWGKYNPTREELEEKREKERIRKAEYRMSQRDKKGTTQGRTKGHQRESSPPDPTRPDPTPLTTEAKASGDYAAEPEPFFDEPKPENPEPEIIQENAGSIISQWIESQGQRPPGRVIGQLSKEIKNLLDEGHPFEEVLAATQAWSKKALHPSTLASVLHEVRNPRTMTAGAEQRLQVGLDLVQRVAARSEETYNYDPFAGKAIEQ